MTSEQPKLLSAVDEKGVATLTLNRPDRSNAMDGETLSLLGEALAALARQDDVRVVVLRGAGKHFCAGVDASAIESHVKGPHLGNICMLLDEMPKPTIAVVQGAAIGAGCGLVACCDVAIATAAARFAVPETRLGLAPAVVSPFLVRALGARQARRFLLGGNRMSAAQALVCGLVHEVCTSEELDAAVDAMATEFRRAAPGAFAVAKQYLRELSAPAVNEAMLDSVEARLAEAAKGPEAREGIASMREKRDPSWFN